MQEIERHASAQAAAEASGALAELRARSEQQAVTIKRLESRLAGLQVGVRGRGDDAQGTGGGAVSEEWRAGRERSEAKLRKRQAQLESAIMQVCPVSLHCAPLHPYTSCWPGG